MAATSGLFPQEVPFHESSACTLQADDAVEPTLALNETTIPLIVVPGVGMLSADQTCF
jgi:hypothetical protein